MGGEGSGRKPDVTKRVLMTAVQPPNLNSDAIYMPDYSGVAANPKAVADLSDLYVLKAGDTMTGNLIIDKTGTGSGLKVINKASIASITNPAIRITSDGTSSTGLGVIGTDLDGNGSIDGQISYTSSLWSMAGGSLSIVNDELQIGRSSGGTKGVSFRSQTTTLEISSLKSDGTNLIYSAGSGIHTFDKPLGIGTSSVGAYIDVLQSTAVPSLLFRGESLDASTDNTNGAVMALAHNASGNRQIVFADSETGIGVRYLGAALDAYNYQSSSRLNLQIGTDSSCFYNIASSAFTVDGSTWNDSTQKTRSVYQDGIQQQLQGIIFTQTADRTPTLGLSDSTCFGSGVGTLTLPANFFVAGKTVHVNLRGYYSTDGTAPASLTYKIKLGSTSVTSAAYTFPKALSNLLIEVDFYITCRTTGSSGSVIAQGFIANNSSTAAADHRQLVNTATTTINTTTSQALDFAVSGVGAAGDSFTFTNAYVEVLN